MISAQPACYPPCFADCACMITLLARLLFPNKNIKCIWSIEKGAAVRKGKDLLFHIWGRVAQGALELGKWLEVYSKLKEREIRKRPSAESRDKPPPKKNPFEIKSQSARWLSPAPKWSAFLWQLWPWSCCPTTSPPQKTHARAGALTVSSGIKINNFK